jgi:ACR3 family arsenite efflux pump ArsB
MNKQKKRWPMIRGSLIACCSAFSSLNWLYLHGTPWFWLVEAVLVVVVIPLILDYLSHFRF